MRFNLKLELSLTRSTAYKMGNTVYVPLVRTGKLFELHILARKSSIYCMHIMLLSTQCFYTGSSYCTTAVLRGKRIWFV